MSTARISKPKTRRGKKYLEGRDPKVVENDKVALLIKGGKINQTITNCLSDLFRIKKPLVQQLHRKNPFHPFEDDTGFEKFAHKYDASLFLFASNTKKRPSNLTFGRMFDYHLLDMAEFRLENFSSAANFPGAKATLGTKPCMIFQGEKFQSDETFQRMKNLFIDWFKGETIQTINLQGLELLITFTINENDRILFRVYRTHLKKSCDRLPRIELEEIGPCMDLVLGRTKLASEDLMKTALKLPRQLKTKPRKNVTQDVFGSKLGRVHLGKQNVATLQTRKVKALKRLKESKLANNDL